MPRGDGGDLGGKALLSFLGGVPFLLGILLTLCPLPSATMPLLSLTAAAPCVRRATPPARARAARAPPAAPLRAASRPRRGTALLAVRADANNTDKAPEEQPRRGVRATLSGVGHWLAQAAAEIFSPVDDHGADFKGTLMPYEGTPLRASDHRRLARVEQVVSRAREQLSGADARKEDNSAGGMGESEGGAAPAGAGEEDATDLGACALFIVALSQHTRAASGRACMRMARQLAFSIALADLWHATLLLRCCHCQATTWPKPWQPFSPSRM